MLMLCEFPVEVLDQVVSSALDVLPTVRRRRPTLAPLAGLSFASKHARAIVLRRYFLVRSAVLINKQKDWAMVTALGGWIHNISCTDAGIRLCNTLGLPPSLTHLRSACLDFDNHTPFKFRSAYTHILAMLPPSLTSLTLTSLPIIKKSLLTTIASIFTGLVDLRLSTVARLESEETCCCACCPNDSERQRLLSVQHSPIPDVFADGKELGHAFGKYLAPLTSLKDLHLGIYLSPEHALSEHSEHDGAQDLNAFSTTSNPLSRFADCAQCCEKYAESTRQSEMEASRALAIALPSLATIEWSSCFVLLKCRWDEGDVSDACGTTKLAVVRNGVDVEVQRVPEMAYGMEWNFSDK